MPLSRYLAHAFILITVVAVSGYASINKQLAFGGLRLGAVNAEGLVNGQGGQVGDVTLGRLGTIIAPLSVPDAPLTPHSPIIYVVSGQESVANVASTFRVSTDDVYWSNGWLHSDTLTNGQRLAISPVPGVVTAVKKGDTLSGISSYWHVDPAAIVDFNYLRSTSLSAGQVLIIPNGKGPKVTLPSTSPAAPPAPAWTPPAASNQDSSSSGTVSGGGVRPGNYSANRFAYGYCTWYVASLVPVPWLGNAGEWPANAAAMGYREGMKPVVGAIAVTAESGYGHVSLVTRVYPDGSWQVTEMNYIGWAIVDSRHMYPGSVPLIAFIYMH